MRDGHRRRTPTDGGRRAFLAGVGGVAASAAGCFSRSGHSDEGSLPDSVPDEVGLETLADGFDAPLDAAFAPGDDRQYVVEQGGVVRVVEAGSVRDRPLLDLRDVVESGGEKGLLGLALHPSYGTNRRLFVRYSAPSRPGTPDAYSHTFVLSAFEATEDGLSVQADSEQTLLEIPQPQSNHNAGDLAFGPEGFLYVTIGDGGGGGDQGRGHVEDWYDDVPGGNGQDVVENRLGSVLRIDVDVDDPYAVPEDNPLVGRPGFDEHYAWGFRNPWRLSFDRERLFVADVGQSDYEEVNLVERGGNYGWNVREGAHCFDAEECPTSTPSDVRGGEPLIDPIVEYSHSGGALSGASVIGGHVYRADAVRGLEGAYVFGDLRANGRLFAAVSNDDGDEWRTGVVTVADGDAGKIGQFRAFGRDADGAVYAVGVGDGGGGLHRIVPV